jgi:hypothetical protein
MFFDFGKDFIVGTPGMIPVDGGRKLYTFYPLPISFALPMTSDSAKEYLIYGLVGECFCTQTS